MAIRLRKIGNPDAIGNFSYIALCAAEYSHKDGDIYLDDAIDHALRNKFKEDYTAEGLIKDI